MGFSIVWNYNMIGFEQKFNGRDGSWSEVILSLRLHATTEDFGLTKLYGFCLQLESICTCLRAVVLCSTYMLSFSTHPHSHPPTLTHTHMHTQKACHWWWWHRTWQSGAERRLRRVHIHVVHQWLHHDTEGPSAWPQVLLPIWQHRAGSELPSQVLPCSGLHPPHMGDQDSENWTRGQGASRSSGVPDT